MKHIGSNEFRQYLHDHILSVSKELNYIQSMHYTKNSNTYHAYDRVSYSHPNNVNSQPRYVFLMAED